MSKTIEKFHADPKQRRRWQRLALIRRRAQLLGLTSAVDDIDDDLDVGVLTTCNERLAV